jgi:heat shock protein HtpX
MLNQLKTVLLLGLLTALLLFIGSFFGGTQGLTIAFVLVLLMNGGSYWFSDKIVLAMYKAKEVDKKQAPGLYKIIEELCKKAKIPKPKIYIVPTLNPNAFCTGRSPKHASIAFTQGILKLLSKEELKGVAAHELAHDKNRDILISTIAATIAGVISYLAIMARFAAIFGGARNRDSGNVLELLFLAFLAPIIALIIRLAISRSREYLADETGAKMIHTGKPLASALLKLEKASKMIPMRMGSEATSHMFIVNPFRAKTLLSFFTTHPSTEKRVDKLNQLVF